MTASISPAPAFSISATPTQPNRPLWAYVSRLLCLSFLPFSSSPRLPGLPCVPSLRFHPSHSPGVSFPQCPLPSLSLFPPSLCFPLSNLRSSRQIHEPPPVEKARGQRGEKNMAGRRDPPTSFESLIDNSQNIKREADALYASGSYSDAVTRYGEAIELLDGVGANDPEQHRKCDIMRVFILLNLAACHHKLEIPSVAASICTQALAIDKYNTKALQRRAQCLVDTGEYVEAYRDLLQIEDIGCGNRDVAKMLDTIREKSPESVETVEEERRVQKLKLALDGAYLPKVTSPFVRAYMIVHAIALSGAWWLSTTLLFMVLIHGFLEPPTKTHVSVEFQPLVTHAISLLLAMGVIDSLMSLLGLEGGANGRGGAADGAFSLFYRRCTSLVIHHYLLGSYDVLFRGWALSACLIMWSVCGLLRYPLKLIIYINPFSEGTVSPAIDIIFLLTYPACLLTEYATLWSALPVVQAESQSDCSYTNRCGAVTVSVFLYPVFGAYLYYHSLRVWSDRRNASKITKRGGRVTAAAKREVFKM
mmetsp:Transcript_51022/g.123685  ORF Transcript_51022/g.123685 Transcript_51022/m.123685 type:complete len:533 (-) Transcript_51022:95-1693(-)